MMRLGMRRFGKAFAVALPIAAALTVITPAHAMEDALLVEVDRAKVVRLANPAATVIIGNPSIADALVQNREMLVVTGKSFGVTNLIVLDADGVTLEDLTIHVRGDNAGVVTIQRGPTRLTYSCAPGCERTLTLGDTAESYDTLTAQIQNRLGLAEGQADPR